MIQTFIKSTMAIIVLSTLVSACGGGGSSDSENAVTPNIPNAVIPDTPTIPVVSEGSTTFSGVVTYTSYSLNPSTGIDYNSEEQIAVSGVVIQLQDLSGNILDSSNTASDGSYLLSADITGVARIVVRAELGESDNVNTRVIDNTNNDAIYSLFTDVTIDSAAMVLNLNAGSGWDGTSYSGIRAAAPFSILDVINQAQALVKSVDSDVTFPFLTVNWSTENNTSSGNLNDGDIGTSFYSNNELFILGDENSDTDEYDKAVVAHEWGHYFEDNFSRSDSIGGPHSLADLLHPSVSWSEGFATAIAAMILNTPSYIDTSGTMQGRAFELNAENDRFNNRIITTLGDDRPRVDGYYSEQSVTQIVYDVFDDGSVNSTSADDDDVALGFLPIYEVLTNGVRDTRSFTSIFAFLHYIRIESSNDINGINTIGNNENIDMVDITEFDDPNDTVLVPVYTDISAGSTITIDGRSDTLQTFDTYGEATSFDAGNKLLNQRFFRATAGNAGCYTVAVTPVSPTSTADVRLKFIDRIAADSSFTGSELLRSNRSAGEVFTFSVDAFVNNAFFSVSFQSTPRACS